MDSSLLSHIGQIVVIVDHFKTKFGQNREISRENAHFPREISRYLISRFPISRREMCISSPTL